MSNLKEMCVAYQANKIDPTPAPVTKRYTVKELNTQWEQEQRNQEITQVLESLASQEPKSHPADDIGKHLADFTNKALNLGAIGLDVLKRIGRTYAQSVGVNRVDVPNPHNLDIAKRMLAGETFICQTSTGLNLKVVNGHVVKSW